MSEHSRRPDDLLTKPRTAILFELNHNGTRPKDSLKQMTVGHQYFRQHLEKPKSSQYLKLNPGRFQLMCERPEVQYGKVVQVHVLRSENCPFSDLSLKELATKRLKMREDLMDIPDLTTYIKYRKSCWFLEETEDGQFRCDCPIGHKGKVCKHELALNYLHKRIEVLPHAAALPLGSKRSKGRPQKITMQKPKEPGYSAVSSTEISSEEGNIPPGRDEASEDIDGLDQLPLVVDEPALEVGGEILVQVVPAPPVAPTKRKVVDQLSTAAAPSKRGRGRPRKIIPVLIQ